MCQFKNVNTIFSVPSSLWHAHSHRILLFIALPFLPEYMDFLYCTLSIVADPCALSCLVEHTHLLPMNKTALI